MRTSSTVSNHHGSPESNRTFASAQSWSRSRANSSTVIWPTGNRPKTPTSGLVSQVGALIHRASKDALPRRFHEPHSVRRPKTICGSADERFDPTYVRVAEAIEFRQLDNPNSACLHRGVFAPQIRQFIGEVLVCQGPKCRGLANALRPFENQTAVCLRAWTENPSDRRNHPARSHGAGVLVVLSAQITRKPSIQPLDTIPLEPLQVGLHGVERMISGCGLDRLAPASCRRRKRQPAETGGNWGSDDWPGATGRAF